VLLELLGNQTKKVVDVSWQRYRSSSEAGQTRLCLSQKNPSNGSRSSPSGHKQEQEVEEEREAAKGSLSIVDLVLAVLPERVL